MLLPDTGADEAMQVAERLRRAVVATPLKAERDVNEEGRLVYSTSLGMTLVNAGGNFTEACHQARRPGAVCRQGSGPQPGVLAAGLKLEGLLADKDK